MKRCGCLLILLAGCSSYSPLDSHYNKGVEFYDRGELGEAIREYHLAIEDKPENYRAHFNLAVCYHDQKIYDAAKAEYEKALKLQPENAQVLVNLASIAQDEGKDEEALALLERAVKSDPHSAFPRSSLGAYYERKKDVDRALSEFAEAVRIDPHHIPGHYRMGVILVARGKLDEAIKEFDAVLAVDPDDVATLLALSEAQEANKDGRKALLLLERALVHIHDRAESWLRLSRLYDAQERLEDAVAALWQVRAIDPANAEAGPRLKSLYERLAAKEK